MHSRYVYREEAADYIFVLELPPLLWWKSWLVAQEKLKLWSLRNISGSDW